MGLASKIRFTVLQGTVGAWRDGRPIALGGPQQRRLLAALLANHDTVISADRLVTRSGRTTTRQKAPVGP